VIGSPPYMAPSNSRAACSLPTSTRGVILYQMLTGTLPYFSTNPARSSAWCPGRCTRPKSEHQVPREISDIVMKALAPSSKERYQWASSCSRTWPRADIDHNATELEDIRKRLKARDVPKKGFSGTGRKPLHARSDTCPFWRKAMSRCAGLAPNPPSLRDFPIAGH